LNGEVNRPGSLILEKRQLPTLADGFFQVALVQLHA
jgi:hypothetical protein